MTGGCLCGAVRFEVTGALTEIELCHCDRCKRAYGAAFAATVYARRSDFAWLSGEDRVAVYDAPLRDRPPAYRHCFCRVCGSPAPLLWEELPFVEIPVALLDAPPGGPPAYHQYVAQRAPWHAILDALARHEEAAPLAEKVLRDLLR
jgi:hypothetical protein